MAGFITCRDCGLTRDFEADVPCECGCRAGGMSRTFVGAIRVEQNFKNWLGAKPKQAKEDR
jgi:hypothetical protein